MSESITALDDDPIVKPAEFSELIGHSLRTLQRWRTTGEGPQYIKLGKDVRYQRSAIQSWLRDRTIPHTKFTAATQPAEAISKSLRKHP